MNISPLPTEVPYVLERHHTMVEKRNPDYPEDPSQFTEDQLLEIGPEFTLEPDQPFEGAPVFVYKPLNPRERARWVSRLYGEGIVQEDRSQRFLDLFEERIIRIENLTVGGEPFDKTKHLEALDLPWMAEVGKVIFVKSKLEDDDAGK